MISRLILLAILSLQAVLSLRLRNTAFEDESLYLYAGHMELQHLLHGAALQGQLLVVLLRLPGAVPGGRPRPWTRWAAWPLARALSLVEMLATTVAALLAHPAAVQRADRAVRGGALRGTESAVFLGNFATYDATCLFLLALAAWIMVRTAAFRWPVFLLAALPAALAVGVKYAGLLFVPTIAVLPALAGWPERGRRVLWYPAGLRRRRRGPAVRGAAAGRHGLPDRHLEHDYQSRSGRRPGQHHPARGRGVGRRRVRGRRHRHASPTSGGSVPNRTRRSPRPATGGARRSASLLTGTALLAPLYQAHLHTDISFLKHIGFGLFFAAPMAGFGLARIMGDYFRRPQIGIAVWSLALVLGMVQSSYLFHVWPLVRAVRDTFARYLKPNAVVPGRGARGAHLLPEGRAGRPARAVHLDVPIVPPTKGGR